ncbi:hypothetical protein [Rhabdothermincola salaria]|uniref:hypothetical protein n=1 Tax=Rhabdothermincola salaria TaxID=2903142 RepID=UPI001E4D7C39|nr:hypothetical protein [Rhabdothermincola salaria]MCD9624404.1 hypothetical protein [Rhabdothermincola salaria]
MRAVLILLVLGAWGACVAGAVGMSTFLIAAVARRVSGRPAVELPRGSTVGFTLYAAAMAVAAAGLAGLVLSGGNSGTSGTPLSAAAWAALPAWAAVTAVAAAVLAWKPAPRV